MSTGAAQMSARPLCVRRENMLKKMMLLALAVGALVAFAAPAVASATTIVDSETKEAGETIDFTGEVGFAGELGGFKECVIHGTIHVSGETGEATVEITNHTCVGTGAFTACTVEEANTEPWGIDINAADLTIT